MIERKNYHRLALGLSDHDSKMGYEEKVVLFLCYVKNMTASLGYNLSIYADDSTRLHLVRMHQTW